MTNSTTWTDADFRQVYAFLTDMRAVLSTDNEYLKLKDCRELLKGECEEARRILSRIADACGAYS